VGSHRFRISGSLGVAVYPGDGADADVLIREADRAMYRAKDGGRDRYSLVATAG
jgi:diguanylate cyclase (GGDEF)-like protein